MQRKRVKPEKVMLWKRSQPRRHFAQLDDHGRCQAFWMLQQPPAAGNWIEVSDADPRWIGRQLQIPGASPVSTQPSR